MTADTPSPFTKEEFLAMSPRTKGYWVYMVGAREDEPNVPERWEPSEHERKEYEMGQRLAVQDVMDCDDD